MELASSPEWADDQTMAVLFAPFRDSRDVNPSSWDKKLNFWTSVITRKHQMENKAYFNAKSLPAYFERKGKVPFCLGIVVKDMLKKGQLQTAESFIPKSSGSWGSWTYGVFVKAPVKFTFDWLVKKPAVWTFQQIVGQNENSGVASNVLNADSTKGLQDVEYVLPDVAKSIGETLLEFHYSIIKNPTTDRVRPVKEFAGLSRHLYKDERTFQLALSSLCNQSRCVLQNVDGDDVIVFADRNQTLKQKVSDTDLSVYRLKTAEKKLQEQTSSLGEEMEKCKREAKMHLQKGMKTAAKHSLRRKKRLEAQQEKKEASIDNIQQLLFGIQQAYVDKEVLHAYSMGVEAMKDINKGLSPEKVDDIMDSIKEVLDDQEELSQSMIVDNELNDLSEEDLLAELEDVAPPSPDRRGPSRVPHQELIDSVCQMRISDGDLPDVPTHDPESPAFGTSTPSPSERRSTGVNKVPLLSEGVKPAYRTPPRQDKYTTAQDTLPDVPRHSPGGSSVGLPSPPSPFKGQRSPLLPQPMESPIQHPWSMEQNRGNSRSPAARGNSSFEQVLEPPVAFQTEQHLEPPVGFQTQQYSSGDLDYDDGYLQDYSHEQHESHNPYVPDPRQRYPAYSPIFQTTRPNYESNLAYGTLNRQLQEMTDAPSHWSPQNTRTDQSKSHAHSPNYRQNKGYKYQQPSHF